MNETREAVAPISGTSLELVWLAVAAALVTLKLASWLFVPVLVAVLLAYALDPPVQWLARRRVPRAAGALVVYAALASGALVAGRLAQSQVSGFLDELPRTVSEVRLSIARGSENRETTLFTRVHDAFQQLQHEVSPPGQRAPARVRRVAVVSPPLRISDYIVKAGVAVALTTFQIGLIGFLAFLFVVFGESYKAKIVAMAGWSGARRVTADVVQAIDRQIQRYLLVRVLISLIVAVMTGIGLWSIGLSYSAVWGGIAGVLNVIPFVGPAVAIVLITVGALVQFHTLAGAAVAGGIATLVAILEGNLISPWLTSRAAELNVVAVFVSVIFWGWLWDVWGLLLAIPIMVGLKAAADHVEGLRGLGELLGR